MRTYADTKADVRHLALAIYIFEYFIFISHKKFVEMEVLRQNPEQPGLKGDRGKPPILYIVHYRMNL